MRPLNRSAITLIYGDLRSVAGIQHPKLSKAGQTHDVPLQRALAGQKAVGELLAIIRLHVADMDWACTF